jgi:hypothetical protein
MRTAVLVFSWLSIVIGALTIISGLVPLPDGTYDPYAFIGGGLFLVQGLLTVIYLSQENDNV